MGGLFGALVGKLFIFSALGGFIQATTWVRTPIIYGSFSLRGHSRSFTLGKADVVELAIAEATRS